MVNSTVCPFCKDGIGHAMDDDHAAVAKGLLAALIAVQDAMHDDMIKVAGGAGSIITQIKQAIAKAESSR